MVVTYPAVFHEEGDGFWVEFPDLIGCQSFGDTLNETIVQAQEALIGYILTILEEGQELQKPADIKQLKINESDFASLVTVDIGKYMNRNTKAVKKTLTIPGWLNERAVQKDINFSKVLQDALMKELDIAK